ncbi:Beta-glucosidase [Mycena kentingensis (nom. inval.)]|nr:Beta-glucosidase [Mycena kentingensis (nom. inval.)]
MSTHDSTLSVAKADVIGTILAGVLYGISIPMFVATLWTLLRGRRWREVHHTMLAVAWVLFVSTTGFFSATAVRLTRAFIDVGPDFPGGASAWLANPAETAALIQGVFLALETLVGDAVVIYRCYMVWRRAYIVALPILLWLGMLITGISFINVQLRLATNLNDVSRYAAAFTACSLACNFLSTGLLAYRLWQVNRNASSTRVGQGVIMPVLSIILDAAALYPFALICSLAVYLSKSPAQFITIDIIPPIISVAFFMVIIRVGIARNKATHYSTSSSMATTTGTGRTDMQQTHPRTSSTVCSHTTTMDRSFLDADIPSLVDKSLTINEKISLLGAPNWWNTMSLPRLNIPSVRMSDGPNGVRGSSHFVASPGQCLPCGTAMGATFDPDLIRQVGGLLAEQAKAKSSVILLAPTCNIQRTPLGGRAFESFSEDPHLSGTMAASYILGLQDKGVSATIKHFVANDQEHERTAAESVMSDRALREIYLYPFMLSQKYAEPGAYMTSYGRVKGIHCSESKYLLQNVLRDEWGFKGLIMSDWYGTYSIDEAINASLDLEMPGPPRFRQPLLVNHCLTAQKLQLETLNERVANLLTFVQKQAKLNPDVVYGDGEERTLDSPEIRAFCRKLAGESIVLLKNRDGVLPLAPPKVKKVAVIGPNATQHILSGGGSAALKASYSVSPYDGVVSNAPDGIEIEYTVGCYAHKYLPSLERYLTTSDGQPGWLCTFYNHDENDKPLSEPLAELVVNDTRVKLVDFLPAGLTDTWSITLTGRLTVPKSAPFELGLTVAGRARLFINDAQVIDNWEHQTPGDFFYGQGSVEEKAVVEMVAGKAVDVKVVYTNTPPPKDGDTSISSQPALMRGVRLGGCEKIDEEEAVGRAVEVAKAADVVVFVAGLTPEWESEGFDRPTLDLPGKQHEVISRIAAANPNTVVVIQAGAPTSMPWIDHVGGVLQTWYLGNEVGNAIADVVWGRINPGGRLPITFPARIEDTPAFQNEKCENGKIYYREDLYVGYKHYHARKIQPLFEFGFGLSYTKFAFSNLSISTPSISATDISLRLSVTLTNTGSVPGSEVAQVYITYPDTGNTTPKYQLKGFAKAKDVAPGASKEVEIVLDKNAFAFWDVRAARGEGAWRVGKGTYVVSVGASAGDLRLVGEVDMKEGMVWRGL